MEKKKKRILISLIISGILLVGAGISYAYWMFTLSQTNPNRATTACLQIELINESSGINLGMASPITNEEGMALEPYEFTIKNTCDSFISYEVLVGVINTSTLDSQYVAAVLDKNQIQTLNQYEEKSLDGYKEGYLLQKGNLSANEEITYQFRMWMDYDTPLLDSTQNQTFESQIVVEAKLGTYNPVEQGFTTLAEAMLVNEYQSSSVENAKAKIEAKQAPDFSKTAPIINWQENHASTTTTTTSTMPHPDLVGTGGIAVNLTNENILPLIGTGYTFDSETGRYTLTGYTSVDPTTLDYNNQEGIKYYYCSASFSTNTSDVIATSRSYKDCTNMYQVVSATKSEGTSTGSGGTSIRTIRYQMTAYKYNQTEQESDKSDRGLYAMEDDHGTSYYYRGSVANNYAKFAGYYWRIIRQNGDGSVRLLYAGTSPNATGSGLQIKPSAFNNQRNNPGYVGYMYGSTFNISYEQTHANENDSTVKIELDNWYKTNIVDKNLSSYIADSGFCNDRTIYSGDGVSATGYTRFRGQERYVNHTPSLVCPNASNDLFTVEDVDGNQALIYPIGLITVDELMLGGLSNGYLNRLSYAYSSEHYWTMSPSYFDTQYMSAREMIESIYGEIVPSAFVTNSIGIRPVISLASNVEIESGIGTANDPFVVKIA